MTATWTDADLLEVLDAAAVAVRRALDGLDDWGLAGTRDGQYRSDLAADAACLAVLDDAGLGWLSEESGVAHGDRSLVVVVDPVDGSTNAGAGIPWYATSLCAVDDDGPRASVVVNQASGRTFAAVRGGGATVGGVPLTATSPRRRTPSTTLSTSIIGMSGYPHTYLGWRQFRVLGAAALDLCAVAEGVLDGYMDASPSAHGVWDYAGALLICQEAGVPVVDAFDRSLVGTRRGLTHDLRRAPVAAATTELLADMVAARRSLRWDDDPA